MSETLSIEERIKRMKSLVRARLAREEEEAQRLERIKRKIDEGEEFLLKQLIPLVDTPLLPNGRVSVDAIGYRDDEVRKVIVRRRGWYDGDDVYEELIAFTIKCDSEGKRIWLEHDDTEITVDVAVDLAVSMVESRLHA